MKKNFSSSLFYFLFYTLCIFSFVSFSFAEEYIQGQEQNEEQKPEWNEGALRLKYEYQHFVISDSSQFITTDALAEGENIENNSSGFCLAEDNKEVDINKDNNKKDKNIIGKNIIKKIDRSLIKDYLEKKVVPRINQEKIDVRIFKDEKGQVQFEGVAQDGRSVNIEESISLIEAAIINNVSYVSLFVEKTPSVVTVDNEELRAMGITELVAVGRSDFNGSTGKRIINVMNGASKFQGYIIEKGETFSFTTILGDIDGSTGYVKELVIIGNKVLPEYGGGLCQVSSTSYRAAMLAGLEIVERHNHSYAVSYYEPHGSDATIYAGVKDFQFKNTSDAAIVIQTRRGGWNNKELFFHYYGTKPEREIKIFGPLKTNYRYPPASKITYDSSRPSGSSQTVSHRVTGFNSQFFRTVIEDGEELYTDKFFSPYQARGTWVIRGGVDPSTIKAEEKLEGGEENKSE